MAVGNARWKMALHRLADTAHGDHEHSNDALCLALPVSSEKVLCSANLFLNTIFPFGGSILFLFFAEKKKSENTTDPPMFCLPVRLDRLV